MSKDSTTPPTINEQTILFEIQKTLSKRLHVWRMQTNPSATETNNNSYVEQLYQQGLNKMSKKVIEEAGEVLMAAKDCQHNNDAKAQQELVNEITDLLFHCMVLLTYYDGNINQVMQEGIKRFGLSGLDEKKNREIT